MIGEKYNKQILEALESYSQKYLEMLKSDLVQYEDKAITCLLKNSSSLHRKIIDVNFDTVARSFELHKIRMVKEEIEILENLDSLIFDSLAYIFEEYTFSFFKEEPTCILPWFIDRYMLEPILNAILYLEKLERRKIDWVNYKRDLKNFQKQLKKRLELTESFFHLIPVQSEDDILRILLTHLHQIHLDIESEGIKGIVFSLFPDGRMNLPKNLETGIKGVLIDAGYYSKYEGGAIIR